MEANIKTMEACKSTLPEEKIFETHWAHHIHKRIKAIELLDSFRNYILLDAGYKCIWTRGNISTEGNKLFLQGCSGNEPEIIRKQTKRKTKH
jgi:hypothetical protein